VKTSVFVERTFDRRHSVADVLSLQRESGWHFDLYNIEWRASLLAANGRTMVCWFVAPDEESVRVALEQIGTHVDKLWSGTVYEPRESVVPNVLVARSFDEAVMIEKIQAIGDAGAPCMRMHHVRYAQTFFSLERRRMLCLYEAPDAESVRLAQREASMPVDAVWAFTRISRHMMSSDWESG